MMRNLLFVTFLCFSFVAQAQYSETFSTPNKGYLTGLVDDLNGVNWSMTPWLTGGGERDASDYFSTTAAGVLECIDLDDEVCWESPLMNIASAGVVTLSVALTWAGFDNDAMLNQCTYYPTATLDYIKVMYSVNGGAYTLVPNVIGGSTCATIGYTFGSGTELSGNTTVNQGSISGTTLKIRVCVGTNQNAEKVTIDNVSVPQAGVTIGCAAPVLTTTSIPVGCAGANTGSINLSVSAGSPPYTYDWSNDGSETPDNDTQDLSNLAVGTYTVTVTDAASCSATTSVTISNSPALSLSTSVLDATCTGSFDGEIDLIVNGGFPGFTYDWSNDGAETPDNDAQDLVNLGTGTYTVTVTDAVSCTATASATVAVLGSGAYLETFSTPNKGYLANFVDDFAAVNWSLSGWANQPPATFGRDVNDFFSTSGGVLTAFDLDEEVCWTSPLIDINPPGTVQFNVPLSWTSLDNFDYINVNYSINEGAFTTVPNVIGGGVGTIQYLSGLTNNGSTTVTVTGISGNTLRLQVCGNFNNDDETMTIDNVAVPSSGGTFCPAPELSFSHTNVTCNGGSNGSIDLTVTGGSSPYTYLWSFNSTTTQDLMNIPAGTYTVTVTDSNAATSTGSVTVTQPNAITLTNTQVNVLCNGAATGSIDLMVSGGTPGYTYAWTGGATTQDRTGLAAGTYTVTVTDANTCTKTLSVTITQPAAIVLTTTQVNVLCNGAATGSIDLMVTGGIPGYTYAWTGGATTQDRTGLTAGTYTVTVTDANTCTKTTSVTITQPTAIVLSSTHVDLLCNGDATGSINLTASGGTGGFTFDWSNDGADAPDDDTEDLSGLSAGSYTVTVTDASGCTKTLVTNVLEPLELTLSASQVNVLCNGGASGSIDLLVSGGTSTYTYDWSNDGAETPDNDTQDLSGLSIGTYTVTVTDMNACTKSISVTITEPLALSLSTTQVDVLCNGAATGSINLTVTGGTINYTYDWSNDGAETPDNDTQDLSGLSAGTYTVTVTDANGCSLTISATITESGGMTLSTTQINNQCFGASSGFIDLSVSGGASGYTFDWSNDGAETPDNDTEDLSGLSAGTYTVTVTDANGCTQTTSATITQPADISLSTSQTGVGCNGGSNGSINLTVSGGTSGYTFDWSNDGAEMPDNDTEDLSGLSVGTYTVTVTDMNGCTKTVSATVTEPSTLTLGTSQTNVSCNGGANGTIDLTVSGGTPGFTYAWTGGVTTQDRTGLAAGTYTVTVTDANSCSKTISATITEPTIISLSTIITPVSCNGGSNGAIDLLVSGGTPGYTYAWTGGAITQDRAGLVAGTYTVTVTDANNCTKTISATVTQPTAIVLSTTKTDVSCFGGANGTIDLNVSGGTPGYTYSWTGGATTQDRTGLAVGTYTVTVTDANGCTKTISTTLSQPTAISLSATQIDPTQCDVADGSIDLTVSGGIPGYTYDWSNDGPETPDNDPQDLVNILGGAYTVTVTDVNNCTATLTRTLGLIDNTPPTITCPPNATVNANASCQGQVGAYAPATLSDNCTTNPTVVQSPAASTVLTGHNSTQTVTLTATDAHNNSASCILTVTLKDVTPPSISCPTNATVNANASCQGQVGSYSAQTLSDNCNPSPTVTQSPASSTLLTGHNSSQVITLTANDGNGNTATCTLTVTLKDVTSPTITCPSNATVNANASCQGQVGSYSAQTLSDNCNPSPTVTQSPASSTILTGHNSSQVITLTANDGNGNTATCTLNVTLKDVTAPTITCPPNATVAANASCSGAIGSYSAQSLSDNCNPSPTVSQSPAPTTTLTGHNSSLTVTLTANDGNGNTNNCLFSVTLKDITGPSIVCKPAIVNLNASGTGSITTSSVYQSGTDNCGTVNLVSVVPSTFTCSNIGANTVTLTANDGNGNTGTCQATVTVADLIPPTMLCRNVTLNLGANGQATLTVAQVNNGSFDNCSIISMAVTPSSFTCANIGSNTVKLEGKDQSGNGGFCNAVVTVVDPILPMAKCKNAIVNIGANGIAMILPAQIDNGSSDNCSFTLSVTPNSFGCSDIGNRTVTLRATDTGGNSATCSAIVTIRDGSAPNALCRNATVSLNSLGQGTLTIPQVDNGSVDNCGITFQSLSQTDFSCLELAGSPWPVTMTLKDASNNTSTCLSYVTVRDQIAPTAVCEDATVTLGPNGRVTVYTASLADNSTDNCSVWSYSPVAKVYTTANIGDNSLVITVRDWSGNAATCTSIITVLPYQGFQHMQQPGSNNSTSSLNKSFEITVYPNPTNTDATMEFELPADQAFQLRIFDLSGRLVMDQSGEGAEGWNSLPLSVGSVSPGVYMLELRSGGQRGLQRLIIQE